MHTFGSSTPHCTADGVLNIPSTVNTIHVARGAWVEGRFNVTSGTDSNAGSNVSGTPVRTLPLHVEGHGVISGSRYTWHGGAAVDSMRAIDLLWSVPMHIDGPTIVDSKGMFNVLMALRSELSHRNPGECPRTSKIRVVRGCPAERARGGRGAGGGRSLAGIS